jgi:hypothetical protein
MEEGPSFRAAGALAGALAPSPSVIPPDLSQHTCRHEGARENGG